MKNKSIVILPFLCLTLSAHAGKLNGADAVALKKHLWTQAKDMEQQNRQAFSLKRLDANAKDYGQALDKIEALVGKTPGIDVASQLRAAIQLIDPLAKSVMEAVSSAQRQMNRANASLIQNISSGGEMPLKTDLNRITAHGSTLKEKIDYVMDMIGPYTPEPSLDAALETIQQTLGYRLPDHDSASQLPEEKTVISAINQVKNHIGKKTSEDVRIKQRLDQLSLTLGTNSDQPEDNLKTPLELILDSYGYWDAQTSTRIRIGSTIFDSINALGIKIDGQPTVIREGDKIFYDQNPLGEKIKSIRESLQPLEENRTGNDLATAILNTGKVFDPQFNPRSQIVHQNDLNQAAQYCLNALNAKFQGRGKFPDLKSALDAISPGSIPSL